ncbi:MAG: F1F0 ATPase subunit 2 [Cryomorphaceae bacterium]|jgi:F1F0 ATPase subunit 2
MYNLLMLILVCVAGVALGVIFFGGLWWTVQKGVSSGHPASLFLFSAVLRMAIVMTGFYLVSGGDLKRLLICVGGFFIARISIAWFMRGKLNEVDERKEESHAP